MSARERQFGTHTVTIVDTGDVKMTSHQSTKWVPSGFRVPLALFLLGHEDVFAHDDSARERTIENYRAEVERLYRTAHDLACQLDLANRQLSRASTGTDLTPKHLNELAERCREHPGTSNESSRSRNLAMARARLQEAADWLRREGL